MKLIKNGRIATDTEVFNGDILIDGEKIIEIGECINADGAEVRLLQRAEALLP